MRGERVAEAGDVHAEQLELGAQVGAGEGGLAAEQAVDDDLGHRVARRHEAEGAPADARDLADRPDGRVRGAARVVDHDAAALADRQARVAGEGVPRADAGGEDDDVGVQVAAVGEVHPGDLAGVGGPEPRGRRGRADVDAEVRDEATEGLAAALVDLEGHEAGGELDDGARDAERLERARGLEAEETTADDGAAHLAPEFPGALVHPAAQGRDVVERAVDEHAGEVRAGDRGDEGEGAGREDQGVVLLHPAEVVGDGAGLAVDRRRRRALAQRDQGVGPQGVVAEVEVLGPAAGEVRGEGDAVVGRARLLGEDRDAPGAGGVAVAQRLDEAVRDHAAADHHEMAGRSGRRRRSRR